MAGCLTEKSQNSLFTFPLHVFPCSFWCSTLAVVTLYHGCHFLLQPPHLLSVLPPNLPVRTQGFTGIEITIFSSLASVWRCSKLSLCMFLVFTCELVWASQSAHHHPSCERCCLSLGLKLVFFSELVPWKPPKYDQMKQKKEHKVNLIFLAALNKEILKEIWYRCKESWIS